MPSDHKSRILIVDDAPENIRILAESLKYSYIIMFANDGKGALRLAHNDPPPDIILLDVIMPDMNGYDVCRTLKDDPATNNIPVIFITSQSDESDEAHGLEMGAVDYISKPFRASLVMTRVANQLELKRHRDELNALVRERTYELSLTREVTIEAMAILAEWRDPETGAHIKRTQNYVRLLADALRKHPDYGQQLDEDMIELFYQSAPLHDVGKVGIPDAILLKPGPLTVEEFDVMKTHTTRGRDALAMVEQKLGGNSSFLRLAREIAYGHHERWDGTGYPQGLKGAATPLPSRLMAVADVYDALTSKRAYKRAMSHEDAFDIILQGKEKHFDPIIIETFVAIQDEFRYIANLFRDLGKSHLPI